MQDVPITLEELQAALSEPAVPGMPTATTEGPTIARSVWVEGLVVCNDAGLPVDALLEVASEEQPGGPLATIYGLLQGLILRHSEDDATRAALSAIERLHLPNFAKSLPR